MSPTPAPRHDGLCGPGSVSAESAGRGADEPPWENPSVAPVLASYRQAAAAILDPDGRHLQAADASNIQYGCRSDRLSKLGTKLGWKSGAALGLVQLEAAPRKFGGELQAVLAHSRWTPYDGKVPDGITAARVADYDDGLAVVAEREDGLTVAVDTQGVWGNNMPPGSAPATDLPGVERLLTLAASPQLTLPEG